VPWFAWFLLGIAVGFLFPLGLFAAGLAVAAGKDWWR
jgi:hypothetical protein